MIGRCQRGFRVVAYDLRGHGDSEPARTATTRSSASARTSRRCLRRACRTDARRSRRPLARRDVDRRVGRASRRAPPRRRGGAAQHRARRPDRRAPAGPVPAFAEALSRTIAAACSSARAPLPPFSTPLTRVISYIAFGPRRRPRRSRSTGGCSLACPPDVRAGSGSRWPTWSSIHALARLTVPTLVMAGAGDRLTPPAHARRIAEALPQLAATDRAPRHRPHGPARATGRGQRSARRARGAGARGRRRLNSPARAERRPVRSARVGEEGERTYQVFPRSATRCAKTPSSPRCSLPSRRQQAIEACSAPELRLSPFRWRREPRGCPLSTAASACSCSRPRDPPGRRPRPLRGRAARPGRSAASEAEQSEPATTPADAEWAVIHAFSTRRPRSRASPGTSPHIRSSATGFFARSTQRPLGTSR